MVRLQYNTSEMIADEFIRLLRKFFGEKIDDFVLSEVIDTPYKMFRLEFMMYKYFFVVLNYDRGSFGCGILNGRLCLSLDNSQKWYDEADMNIFLKELEEQIELRIPDKFLKHYGWK